MILTRVEIENYKQYAGHHEIDIPNAATVGVIGNNGVGKTTLFEAIEWCLYNPAHIKAKDIRPRGRSGFTKVTVLMEDSETGRNVIVERELKKTATVAAIYEVQESGDESLIVQGTKPVSDYVATKLIGLSHHAFVATFFTRQKELSFFGGLGDSDRRREVSRLLGLETIRHAQQTIAEDRKRLNADAATYRRLHDDQAAGHDFPTEIAAAREAIAQRHAEFATSGQRIEDAGASVAVADRSVQAIELTRDRDAAVRQVIVQHRGERTGASDRLDVIARDLERISAREQERDRLLPVASRLQALNEDVTRLDAARERFLRRKELSDQVHSMTTRRKDTLGTIASLVRDIVLTEQIPGWMWSLTDDNAPEQAIARVLTAASSVDLAAARLRERQMSDALDIAKRLHESTLTHRRYVEALAGLEQQRTGILETGEPTRRIAELDAARDANQQALATIVARKEHFSGQANQTARLIGNLEHQHFEAECPTCARPFTASDAAEVLDLLRSRLEEITRDLDTDDRDRRQIEADTRTIHDERTRQVDRQNTLNTLTARIETGRPMVEQEARRVEGLQRDLDATLRDSDLTRLPTPDELEEARERVVLYGRIVDCVPGIERGRSQLASIAASQATAHAALEQVADATFDEAHYQTRSAERQQADRAQTAILQIEREISRRPDLERERSGLQDRIVALDHEVAANEQTLTEIGFDPTALVSAQQALRDARNAEKEAINASHGAQIALRDATSALDYLEREQVRIADLIVKADAAQREADTAERMYREFTEFDKYAAAHYTPILGDMTSELVSEVTDGKYDRVEFDGNYGIEIFDGSDERFPLGTFSGGERDAIALCARLALSRMIGSQAVSPPGFLVLDEVFGSLDRERRARLLDMLGSISASNESFRQMFIISHVDDVRSAPLFDELWRVEESEDGVSQIRSLTGRYADDDL